MLNRMAGRICAVQAVTARTAADGAIKDSEITPADFVMPGDRRPFVAVYTDDQDGDSLAITFDIGVTGLMTMIDEDSGKQGIMPGIPPTDAGMELTLDTIERQIHVALADSGNGWAELLRILFGGRPWEVRSRRGANASEGQRFAGRQVTITGKPLADPEFGRPLAAGGFWEKFLAALDACEVPGFSAIAGTVRALLGVDAETVGWQRLQSAIVATRGQADALGIAPGFGDTLADIERIEVEGGQ